MRGTTWLVVAAALAAACGQDAVDNVQGVGITGARRLSRNEYDNTLRDLLLDESRSGFAKLPEDVTDPFDNDFHTQQPSAVLVEAAETLATEAAARLLADPAKRDQVVGCTPTGPGDADCLRAFVTHFGRLALRRPLTDDEITALLTLQDYAVEGNDFYIAVGNVIATLLQHPEFLYRVELGSAVAGRAGLFRLNDHEIATRLSYFVWGSTPDDALLDVADAKQLHTPDAIRTAAERLLADPRAHARVDRFHALWLGYHQLPHPADLTNSMRTETGELIDRVVFQERRPWTDIFTFDETYIDATLAALYNMPAPASGFAWTPYATATAGARRGILSHGAFLSVAGKFGDTSPTQRGKLIRERLLCESIPPPPPNVNVDQPPTSPTSTCKYDRYEAHRSNGSCSGCHSQMDPVGFGLENYDQVGVFRTHDNGDASCIIAGDGLLFGLGEDGAPIGFNGPGELAQVLVDSGRLEQCLVTQVYRFAVGHRETDADARYIAALSASFAAGHHFDDLILDLVTAEQFGYRQEESP
jgi:uncharacterized protein DUF1592/uncharacterized protein DUF1588/uncharacterized protein DUF1595/uncharacterized protein DUF1585/uncharacterized protein DUF1587